MQLRNQKKKKEEVIKIVIIEVICLHQVGINRLKCVELVFKFYFIVGP